MATLLDPDRALELVLERSPVPVPERRPLGRALGAVLLEPVRAVVAQPPFDKSMMDGFAVRVADAGHAVRCGAIVAAGSTTDTKVEAGTAVEIMTGAPCPAGTEAVVEVEDVVRDGDRVTLPSRIEPGQHVQPRGRLCAAGHVVLPAGSVLTSVGIASAAAVGVAEVVVPSAPTVAVVTTGDELAAAGAPLGPAQIHESNGVMLEALARLAGAAEVLRLHAADTEGSLREAIARASDADVVVLSGGVSMGRHDLVPKVLEATGWTRVFHKVAQKPGKPIFFGVDGARLVFGLPGTPLGSHVGFHRYVAAALRKRLGRDPMCPTHHGRLAADWTSSGSRTLFRLARAVRGAQGWVIDLLEWGGSSDLVGPARANCYLRLPPGTHRLQAGDSIPFELLDGA